MAQTLLCLQSLWAMERRQPDRFERSLEENIRLIAAAGYDGVSTAYVDPPTVARIAELLRPAGLAIEAQCFPDSVDGLKPVLELATRYGCHHLDLQPNIRPRKLGEAVAVLEGWLRLAEQVDFPVLIETHRDRMTTDLFFTLDLLDAVPSLRLCADLSHFLVGREFAWPVDAANHAMMQRILDHSWALHGRVASREQVQIEIGFPQHRPWLDLFLDWWEYGMRSFRQRAGADATLAFTCELGPAPYAITGRDGCDTTDRWEEALLLRREVQARWARVAAEAAAGQAAREEPMRGDYLRGR